MASKPLKMFTSHVIRKVQIKIMVPIRLDGHLTTAYAAEVVKGQRLIHC